MEFSCRICSVILEDADPRTLVGLIEQHMGLCIEKALDQFLKGACDGLYRDLATLEAKVNELNDRIEKQADVVNRAQQVLALMN